VGTRKMVRKGRNREKRGKRGRGGGYVEKGRGGGAEGVEGGVECGKDKGVEKGWGEVGRFGGERG